MLEMDEAALRIGLIGAFPFPYPQGSQVFFAEQARALMRGGARPVLLSYGRGVGEASEDLALAPSPAWTSPRAMRSGPQWGKPFADAGLLATLIREASGDRFDALLAHNAEAALIALAARPRIGAPVIYVAHTLLRYELSAYGPVQLGATLDRIGGFVDRAIAKRVDGTIALCEEARAELSPHARGPLVVLPPGHDPTPAPDALLQAHVCAAHDLTPGEYALYSGNLDGYQDLELLEGAASRLGGAMPVVIATHDANPSERYAAERGNLRLVVVDDFESMRALCHAALVLVATRRRRGGFPIKLLNYMETGRPIVAFRGVAVGLRDGESAWLLEDGAGSRELADALGALRGDSRLCDLLGHGARRSLADHHAWGGIADQTLGFIHDVRRRGALREPI